MSDFLQRLGTGVLFFIVVIGATLAHEYSFAALWLIALVLGLIEYYKLIQKTGVKPHQFYGILQGVILFVTCFFYVKSEFNSWALLLINFLPVYLLFMIDLWRKDKNSFQNLGATFMGILYVALPFSLLNFIVIDINILPSYNFRPFVLIGMIMTLWANDSWAYLWGNWFGKKKLFPSISPGKTWEGFIGGYFSCLLWAWLMSVFIKDITLIDWLVVASILSLIGTLGDLVESKLKRSIGVKDSGSILPGHGGILDRFDALIISTPFVVFYLYFKYWAMA